MLKEYDATLAEWASRAERELVPWLRNKGYSVERLPHGQHGVDLHCDNGGESFYLEVERRTANTWASGEFPYPTLSVPERRGRYGRETVVIACREDIRAGVVVFKQSLTEDRLKHKTNRMVRAGEMFFDVPMCECLPVSIPDDISEPFAVMNVRRIRQRVKEAMSVKAKMNILGDEPPYGMSRDEWSELKAKAEKPLDEQITRCSHPTLRDEPDTFGRSDYVSSRCAICDKWMGSRPTNLKQ